MRLKSKRLRELFNLLSSFLFRRWIAFPAIPIDNRIQFFKRDRQDFGFLSNFYPCKLRIAGQSWPHVEAYYQAQKSENPEYHKEILKKKQPSWAKFVGDSRLGSSRLSKKSWFRKHPEDLRDDWDLIKVEVMQIALYTKFSQNYNLRLALLKTLPAELIEDSAKDSFWGWGEDGCGKNLLGVLLMQTREEMKG